MRIALGNDHRAVKLKNVIMKFIESEGHTSINCGCDTNDSVDYPDFASLVADKILREEAELGILMCATGIGMSIAANKHRGIRAALCCSPDMAARSRQHNDANILCMGADFVDIDTALKIVSSFIKTGFEGGRHQRRLDRIAEIEGF